MTDETEGKLKTYVGLFGEESDGIAGVERIKIPLIQRDYAQGRPAEETKRRAFLNVLFDAIVAGGEALSLDFVWGRVDDGALLPLDGQQRLTTLFLLHWYVASAAAPEQMDAESPWTRLSYDTRPGARDFCRELGHNALPQPLPAGFQSPKDWIVDQPWYLHEWRYDPTIQAMLVMIGAIHEKAGELGDSFDANCAWMRLTDSEDPAISFYLLPLDEMQSDEDLYITMNSRGKPLTDFEIFKARFVKTIAHAGGQADRLAFKLGGEWYDLFWPPPSGRRSVDEDLLNYIKFILETREMVDETYPADGDPDARAEELFGSHNDHWEEHLRFFSHAFDCWKDGDEIASTFAEIFVSAEEADYDPTKTVALFDAASPNLFVRCCSNSQFRLGERLLLYAVLLHRVLRHREQPVENFHQRIRVVRNLVEASGNEIRIPTMAALLSEVETIIATGDLDELKEFNSNQIEDEKRKRAFLDANPGLRDPVARLEDHTILRGTLTAFDFELSAETFRQRAATFEEAFADQSQWWRVTGALLATGEYQRRTRSGWQFGTSANRSRWRDLLTGNADDLRKTRTVLGDFLDHLDDRDGTIEKTMDAIINEWLAEQEQARQLDWRYYLVKYPRMRTGELGVYNGIGGYLMYMMRKVQFNGYYWDPILLAVWEESGVNEAAEEPKFINYVDELELRLVASGTCLLSDERGFKLRAPAERFLEDFESVCNRYPVKKIDENLLLRVDPISDNEHHVDSVDRVELGAEFVKALVAANL